MEGLTFRIGATEDLDACMEIAAGLPEYFNAPGLERMREDLERDPPMIGLAGEEVVAFIQCVMRSERVAEITWMAVMDEYRGKGAGTALLNEVLGFLAQVDCRLVMVKTLAEKADYKPYVSTRRFYEARGFLLTEVIDPYIPWEPGNPCAIYVKPIDGK